MLTDGYPIPLRGATAPYLEDPAACPPLTEGALPLAEGLREPEPAPCELDLIGAMRDAQRLLQEDFECSWQADVPRIQHCVILTESDGVLQYLHPCHLPTRSPRS